MITDRGRKASTNNSHELRKQVELHSYKIFRISELAFTTPAHGDDGTTAIAKGLHDVPDITYVAL
jgi:hypothetical protein